MSQRVRDHLQNQDTYVLLLQYFQFQLLQLQQSLLFDWRNHIHMEQTHIKAAKQQAGPTAARGKTRFAGVDESGDPIECSGKYCRSCMAGMIADCVALCCCPCAVLHFFALAFLKAPLMAGRKCLGLKRRKKKKKKKKKCKSDGYDVVLERDRENRWVELESKIEEMCSESACFEADKVWLELYQIGHLGFGRVSFKEN